MGWSAGSCVISRTATGICYDGPSRALVLRPPPRQIRLEVFDQPERPALRPLLVTLGRADRVEAQHIHPHYHVVFVGADYSGPIAWSPSGFGSRPRSRSSDPRTNT